MKDSKRKPQNIQEIETKLRQMGINQSLAHLSDSGSSSFSEEKSQRFDNAITEESDNEPSDWCLHVFGSFLSVYETQWEYQYGSLPTGKFIVFAESIDPNGLNRVLKHCHERIQLGNSWPPQMGELWVLRDALTSEELLDSRLRVLSRKPENKLEKWLIQNKLYDLSRVAENKLDALFKKYYLEAKRLEERGELKTELVEYALPSHSVKNLNDLQREEYETRHGKALNPRIQKIINEKKLKS